MGQRRFRFGAVAVAAMATDQGSEQWQATARRAEELGYSTLLMPDGTQLPATLPALAIAATVTSRLRVGSFVLASPLHGPRLLAWEAHSLTQLTGGRFEMGIGTGHPDVVKRQSIELYGGSPLPGAERLARVGETIDRLRELDGGQHTPVLLTAAGPRAIAMAAEKADIVGIGAAATSSREQVREKVDGLRSAAGSRFDELELTMNLFVVGDEVPEWTQRFVGVDAATLRAADSLSMLRGSTDEMVDELERRREVLHVSYLTVQGAFMDALAPVVERLAGK